MEVHRAFSAKRTRTFSPLELAVSREVPLHEQSNAYVYACELLLFASGHHSQCSPERCSPSSHLTHGTELSVTGGFHSPATFGTGCMTGVVESSTAVDVPSFDVVAEAGGVHKLGERG